ncbi:hypothetical protein DPMN_081240 [Dreissena polymorpha]|uniref:Uncharacterized protein n=1 Tax=Dreissena polymorpha TaxID=45954 RepID=A0A9D4BG40_DREPO|nr:hypothetical protein DPMN_081240 [Dreissena polymorpha]
MRTEYLRRLTSEEDSDSDCSMTGGLKKVHFCGSDAEAMALADKPSKLAVAADMKFSLKSSKKRQTFSTARIDRGDIPDGSDVFRQVLKEIQTEDREEEVCTPRSDCDTPSKPLKSILKKK